jgi:hypothetical protein
MLNNQGAESKYTANLQITGNIGAVGTEDGMTCHAETQIKVEVSNVGALNVILVRGKIRGSTKWTVITSITGIATAVIDVSLYDYVSYYNSVSDGTGSIVASGFIFNLPSGGGGGAGDASAANQLIGNASLASIDGKIPTIGIKTSAASLPVVLASDSMPMGSKGAIDSFMDEFKTIDSTKWTASIDAANADWVDGNAGGAEYRKLTLSAIAQGVQSYIYSRISFKAPTRVIFGISLSQRILGEEHSLELVDVDDSGVPTVEVADAPLAISSIRVLTNVAYITFASSIAGKFVSLDRICIYGCSDPVLNQGPVVVTTIWPTQNIIVVPTTKSDGTYTTTAQGNVLRLDPSIQAKNSMGLLLENVTVASAISYTKNDGGDTLISASQGYALTAAVQASVQPFVYSFQPGTMLELLLKNDEAKWASQAVDGVAAPTVFKKTQSVPASDKNYVVRFRQRNLPNKTVPIGKIVSITKSGATTATVVLTSAPTSPLVAGDILGILGSNDQTANASSATGVLITSVTNTTTFVVTWGATATTVSWGGVVFRQHGGQQLTAAQLTCVRGIARSTNGYMMIATQALPTVLIGETINIQGVRDNVSDIGIDGRYKVAMITPNLIYGNTNTSTVVNGISDTSLIAVGTLVTGSGVAGSSYVVSVQAGVGFTLNAATTTSVTNTPFTFTGMIVEATGSALQPVGGTQTASIGALGGAIIKETDFRLNLLKVLDYNRTPVEVVGGQNTGDNFNSPSVYVTSGSTMATVTTVTTVAAITALNTLAGIPLNTTVYDLQHFAASQATLGAVV